MTLKISTSGNHEVLGRLIQGIIFIFSLPILNNLLCFERNMKYASNSQFSLFVHISN